MIIRILFLYTGSHCDNPVVWIQLFPHPRGPRPGGVWVLVHGLPDRPLRSYQVATFLSLASCQSGAKHLLHHYSSIFKKSFTREIKLAKTFLSSYNFYNYPTARIKRILSCKITDIDNQLQVFLFQSAGCHHHSALLLPELWGQRRPQSPLEQVWVF